jgi:penicillin-binding protein 2
MKKSIWLVLFIILGFTGCSAPAAIPGTTNSDHQGNAVDSANLQAVKDAARAYLDGWKASDYASMYALLTSVSQDAISEDEFQKHYQGVAIEAALGGGIDYEILSVLTKPSLAQVSYRVTLHSTLVGDIQNDTLMNLSQENGQWRVQWDDTLVMSDLKGGNYLKMDRNGYTPSRANIYDKDGHALVAQADATAIGLWPDQIDPAQTDTLYAELSNLTGDSVEEIQQLVASAPKGAGWYIPLGEYPAEFVSPRSEVLSSLKGLELNSYKARYYFDGGIAPHIVGYVGQIQADQLGEYLPKGYKQDDIVGQSGLEKWGEPYLAGKRGGALYVLNAQGQPIRRLAESPAEPSQAIYTTLDRDYQEGVQQAISGFRGAIVVVERDTGRILAFVSSPGFDPNAFEPFNFNSTSLLSEINNPSQPLINRASQGQYPPGSIFKIVTMAAALESGNYTPESTYQCGYVFNELPGVPRYDWTYEYFQQDHVTQPSGLLTLPEGLMRSCNPFFWHIGLDLYDQGLTKAISEMARRFGLGRPTGIEGVDEASGQVPDPVSQVDALNLAIGQGDMLVTPLQVVDFIAAIGNGGTIYRPQIVEKIEPPDGAPTYQFHPQVVAQLPLKPETISAIQDGMIGVVSNTKPRGTAYHIFTGLDIPVAGKTGTATSGQDQPHAWFAGYTYASREDKPDIAAVVIVENGGEGSAVAAPIFRRVVELYFRGKPEKLYDWESTFNKERTPTPDAATPAPGTGNP